MARKSPGGRLQLEQSLCQAAAMVEAALDMRERSLAAERAAYELRALAVRTTRAANSIQAAGRSCFGHAHRLLTEVIHSINESSAGDAVGFSILRHQAERLSSVISREAVPTHVNDTEHSQMTGLSDRILRLESRVRPMQAPDLSVNTRGSRCDIDDRYPDMSSSRESLMDLGNVVSLPPVPEDSLGNFYKLAVRTSSLSSLKSFRKVKLCLQRASSEEDEDSESEEHSFASSDEQGSSDKETRPALLSQKKNIMLGNIKEEV